MAKLPLSAGRHVLGQQAAVLPVVHHPGELAGRPALLVDVLGFEQLLDQPDLVVGIEDGEIGLEADQLGMAAQDAGADGVEGAEPRHALDAGADQLADALLHLAGGLVGEGHRQDFGRPGALGGEDMGDAGGQHARLAGAGAGQHQQRALGGQHGVALFLVEALEVVGRLRPAELAGDRAGGGAVESLRFGGHEGLTNLFSFSSANIGSRAPDVYAPGVGRGKSSHIVAHRIGHCSVTRGRDLPRLGRYRLLRPDREQIALC